MSLCGIHLGREPESVETTICNFRHLLEKHGLGEKLFDEIKKHLLRSGIRIGMGAIIDTTIIHAPRRTKKGGKWYFVMKAHIDIDREIKMIHSACATSVSVHGSQMAPKSPHGKEAKI